MLGSVRISSANFPKGAKALSKLDALVSGLANYP